MNLAVEVERTNKSAASAEAVRLLPIGETGRYINGLAFKPGDWSDDGLPIIRIQNLTDPTKEMNRTTRAVDPVYLVQPGDLLVSWSATLDAFIWDREPALLNQHIFKVVPDTNVVLRKYLFFALRQAIVEMSRTEHLHGSTMKHINRGPFLAHRIRVPPKRRQAEIVAEIDKQFSRLDEAVANLRRVKASLKRYVAAVLKAAFQGRLVPTEVALANESRRPVECGRELLRHLLDARRTAMAHERRYRTPVEPNAAERGLLPSGWTWATADQLTLLITDGEHITPARTSAGVLLLSARNVLNGRLALDDVDFISEGEHARLCKRLNVQAGDVLLSCSGSVGRSCVVPQGLRFSLVRSVAVLRPNGVVPDFLSYQIRSPACQEQIEDAKTETAQANLFQGKIRQLVFALPPLAEQRRIVEELDLRLSIAREVEAEVDANLKRAQALRQAVLARAFAGVNEAVPSSA